MAVSQGCVISPWLFHLYMNIFVNKYVAGCDGVIIENKVVAALAYANKLIVFA